MEKVTIKFFTTDDFEKLDYQLDNNQLNFTILPHAALSRFESRINIDLHPMVINVENECIGFFILDDGKDKYEFSSNPQSLLVRSLSINSKFQHKGYGILAMKLIDKFVKENFPTCDELVLGVNVLNTSAYHLYLKVEYNDSGKIFKGSKGDQHILSKKNISNMNIKKWFYSSILILIFTSCTVTHNVPTSQVPNNFINPNISSAYVDQNGNFFPNQWKEKFGVPSKNATRKEYSLMKIATENGFSQDLTKFENAHLNSFANRVKNKDRIIIFVHGINNDYMHSLSNYNKARTNMDLNTQKDEVVNFYWDGLKTTSIFGAAKVWVSATTNSKLAGEYGLRRILNSVSNKEIYIISHSRGAAVVLSAIANPALKATEKRIAEEFHHVEIEDAKPLQENGNKIYSIMLAPAIGIVDFQNEDAEFKVFSPQLKMIYSTINKTDFVLGKGKSGILSKSFTSTDFGFNPETQAEIAKQYNLLDFTDFTGQKSHEFRDYITNPKFKEILKKFKLAK